MWERMSTQQNPPSRNNNGSIRSTRSDWQRKVLTATRCGYFNQTASCRLIEVLASIIATPSAEIVGALLGKHPEHPPPIDQTQPIAEADQAPPIPPWVAIAPDEIRRAVARFLKSSAGGRSGLTQTHLPELLSIPTTDDTTGLGGGLTKPVNRLATGDVP